MLSFLSRQSIFPTLVYCAVLGCIVFVGLIEKVPQ